VSSKYYLELGKLFLDHLLHVYQKERFIHYCKPFMVHRSIYTKRNSDCSTLDRFHAQSVPLGDRGLDTVIKFQQQFHKSLSRRQRDLLWKTLVLGRKNIEKAFLVTLKTLSLQNRRKN
jgi:hypothetical protein